MDYDREPMRDKAFGGQMCFQELSNVTMSMQWGIQQTHLDKTNEKGKVPRLRSCAICLIVKATYCLLKHYT